MGKTNKQVSYCTTVPRRPRSTVMERDILDLSCKVNDRLLTSINTSRDITFMLCLHEKIPHLIVMQRMVRNRKWPVMVCPHRLLLWLSLVLNESTFWGADTSLAQRGDGYAPPHRTRICQGMMDHTCCSWPTVHSMQGSSNPFVFTFVVPPPLQMPFPNALSGRQKLMGFRGQLEQQW